MSAGNVEREQETPMKMYCKAYHLGELRQYPGWHESPGSGGDGLTDGSIVYLWDDYTVVENPVIADNTIIFDAVTPAWQEFCTATLQFSVPDDVKEMQSATDAHQQPNGPVP
jgi:hypothetical protein